MFCQDNIDLQYLCSAPEESEGAEVFKNHAHDADDQNVKSDPVGRGPGMHICEIVQISRDTAEFWAKNCHKSVKNGKSALFLLTALLAARPYLGRSGCNFNGMLGGYCGYVLYFY